MATTRPSCINSDSFNMEFSNEVKFLLFLGTRTTLQLQTACCCDAPKGRNIYTIQIQIETQNYNVSVSKVESEARSRIRGASVCPSVRLSVHVVRACNLLTKSKNEIWWIYLLNTTTDDTIFGQSFSNWLSFQPRKRFKV